jgi:hypothetical protein
MKYLFGTWERTQWRAIRKTTHWKLHEQVNVAFYDIRTEPINTPCGVNTHLLVFNI